VSPLARRASPAVGDGDGIARGGVYLHPGEVVASATPLALTTILGSCVGVCLFDEGRGAGGMNHFLLPGSAGHARPTPRFGDVAMERLLEAVLEAGARRARLSARVYGGACVLAAFCAAGSHLGERNLEAALAFLDHAGIPVLARDTGGRRGRRLVFHTDSGAAQVRRI
jgi:chemotaxis protein CheD